MGIMTTSLAVLFGVAFALEILLGDPPNRLHPVCLMGWLASKVEPLARWCLGNGLAAGMAGAITVMAPFTLGVWLATLWIQTYYGPLYGWIAAGVCLWICFAPRGLALHAWRVLRALKRGDMHAARKKLSMMVGRDTAALNDTAVVRGCVESVAENFTDGVASPIFFAIVGGILAGPPGAAAGCVFNRVSNTLDSMWGKLNDRYRRYGTFAARLDDVLNFIPARMAWLVSAFTALPLGLRWTGALQIGLRDSGKHESPNSAWTEATFSGALGIQLGGPCSYSGRMVEHPWIGDPGEPPAPRHVRSAVALMLASTFSFAAVCMAAAVIVELLRTNT